jgi:single-strand DNA-binding protein
MNKCAFTGRLVADPKLITLPSGKKVCKFRVAIDRKFKDKDGKWQSDPSFANFEAWDEGGVTLKERYKKGSFILMDDCSLKTSRYKKTVDDKEVEVEELSFRCNHFELLPHLNAPQNNVEEPAGKSNQSKKNEQPPPEEEAENTSEDDIPF